MNTYEDGNALQDSLFRKSYRQLSDKEIALYNAIKDKADELASLFFKIDDPLSKEPNIGLAIAHLEDAVYRAVKAIID